MLIIVEEILRSEKFNKYYAMLMAFCALLFLGSVYLGYMIGLFTTIYFIIRCIQLSDNMTWFSFLKKIGAMAVMIAGGITISLPVLLPSINELLFNSDRITSGDLNIIDKIKDFLLVPYSKEALKTLFLRMLSCNLEGAGNDFFGSTGIYANDYYIPPELFFSVFILTFVIVYFVTMFKREKSHKQRIARIVSGCLVAFLIFNRLGSSAFNAFVTTFGRYTYLLMPVFAIVVMTSMDELIIMGNKQRYVWLTSVLLTDTVMMLQYAVIITGVTHTDMLRRRGCSCHVEQLG